MDRDGSSGVSAPEPGPSDTSKKEGLGSISLHAGVLDVDNGNRELNENSDGLSSGETKKDELGLNGGIQGAILDIDVNGDETTSQPEGTTNRRKSSMRKRPAITIPKGPRIQMTFRESLREHKELFVGLGLVLPIIVVYIILGAFLFSFIEEEPFVDSIYWAVITMFTVGFGDMSPKTVAGKIYFIFFITFSITVLAGCISYVYQAIATVQNHVRKHRQVKIPSRRDVVFSLLISVGIMSVLVAFGGLCLYLIMNLSPVDGMYLSLVTLTTVGYGDIPIVGSSAKAFMSCFVVLGVTVFTARVGHLLRAFSMLNEAKAFEKMIKKGVTPEMIEMFDVDNSGEVDITEFTLGFLVVLGNVSTSDLAKIRQLFKQLDRDGSGKLNLNDCLEWCQEQERIRQEQEQRQQQRRGSKIVEFFQTEFGSTNQNQANGDATTGGDPTSNGDVNVGTPARETV